MSHLDQANDIFNPDKFLKNVAVDNVIFGYHEKELKVLLQRPIEFKKWTLTGGYVKKTESIEDAAARVATLRTGLQNLFLQQFRCFGKPHRAADKEFTAARLNKMAGTNVPADFWIFDQFISIGFYTLTEFSKVSVSKGPFDDAIEWWSIEQLPPMMFDHKEIIGEALKALRIHINHYPIGYELLPKKFTLPEIHSLYETILGKPLDNRNFARKLMAAGIIKKLQETRSIGPHRSPFLYRFDKAKYDAAITDGLFLVF